MSEISHTPLGTTIAYPLQLDGMGGFVLVSDEAAVANHIRAIIESPRGSHNMEPWFGVPRLPFRPVSFAQALAELIKRAILDAEDRIEPDRLDVRVSEGLLDSGFMPVTVRYVVKGEASEHTLAAGYRDLL